MDCGTAAIFYNCHMFVSVLVTSYNYEKYIKDAINSIKNQTFEDWELIIVDDASNDRSVEIIKKELAENDRVRIVVNDENTGLGLSLEKAFKYSRGEWIAILESDDTWEPDYLAEKVKVILQNPDAGVVFNDVSMMGESDKIQRIINSNRKFLRGKNFPRNMFYDMNLHNRILTFSSIMIKRELLEKINWKTPSDRLLDWWIYIQLAYSNKFYYIDKELTNWRIHADSYINKKSSANCTMTNVLAMIEVFRKNHSLKLFIFILYTIPAFVVMKLWNKFFAEKK